MGRGKEAKAAALLLLIERNLLIRRLGVGHRGFNPNLEKVSRLVLRGIELAVYHARACRHRLNCTGSEGLDFPHAVTMGQRTVEHIRQDFHVAMGVRTEAPSSRDAIVIDDSQRAETHVRRIMIAGKGEGVITVDPSQVGMPPIGTSANYDHFALTAAASARAERLDQAGSDRRSASWRRTDTSPSHP